MRVSNDSLRFIIIKEVRVDPAEKKCYYYIKINPSCGSSSMVEHEPSKLVAWVRFPSPAPV